jgi:hypothetical protein
MPAIDPASPALQTCTSNPRAAAACATTRECSLTPPIIGGNSGVIR